MNSKNGFYNYSFGSMGRTRETALQSDFFRWFHLEVDDHRAQEPGQRTTFRPTGEAFHKVCSLETLETQQGELVQMDLVVQRSFLDGRDDLYAQDLVKSFLVALLPDACQYTLRDFMQEIQTPRGIGCTPGWLVVRGERKEWAVQTGWSRLSLENVELPEGLSLVVSLCPNPEAPNARKIETTRPGLGGKLLALLGMAAMMLCSCAKPLQPETSLKGTWSGSTTQIFNCGKATPLAAEKVSMDIREAPLLNRAVSSFNFADANVTGTVTMTLRIDHPRDVVSGLLVGEIVNGAAGSRLQGYVLSEAEYGAWVAKNKQSTPPADAGEVDLAITGDAAHGYTLMGDLRSNAACGNFTNLDAVANDLTGHFGRSVPAEWSGQVTLRTK